MKTILGLVISLMAANAYRRIKGAQYDKEHRLLYSGAGKGHTGPAFHDSRGWSAAEREKEGALVLPIPSAYVEGSSGLNAPDPTGVAEPRIGGVVSKDIPHQSVSCSSNSYDLEDGFDGDTDGNSNGNGQGTSGYEGEVRGERAERQYLLS